MKTGDNKTPGTRERARGISKWQTNSDGDAYTPEGDASLDYRQCSDDGIADLAARLCKPPPTLGVIFKVKADIARRGLSLPEVVFVAPDHHPETLMDLVRKVRALADELANLGSFVVCDRTGDSYIIAGVNEE